MIANKQQFQDRVSEIQTQAWYRKPLGFGIAKIDRGQLTKTKILQATFACINWNENYGSAAVFLDCLQTRDKNISLQESEAIFDLDEQFLELCMGYFAPFLDEAKGEAHKNIQVIMAIRDAIAAKKVSNDEFKIVFIFEDTNPRNVETVYLKLYALSSGKAALRSLNLNGAFGVLHNVAWSNNKPIELEWLRINEVALKIDGTYPMIDMVDKFPRFLSHIIPADNTRILDTSKVRFGAHLASGTTIMPGASYVNFNSGTTGPVMVEGRISSSVVVGSGSDVGGGASILGVLSGTDGIPVSIGSNTLLGANSVTGISLGDGCIVDAGIAILAGTKITIQEDELVKINAINNGHITQTVVKGKDLSGLHGIHFRVDSTNGQIIARRSTREVKLNADLH